jgi:hypothetical protein
MELINATRMTAGYTMGLEPSGRELLVVVMKGTFVLPKAGEAMRLADAQLPLVMADTFTAEPGFSAPVYEVDFAPRKPACDVLLVGGAHAPAGMQVTGMSVGLRVGPLVKRAEVFGERLWQRSVGGYVASAPQHFTQLPLSYDCAFGGVDKRSADEAQHDAYAANPVGRGWFSAQQKDDVGRIEGAPLPNLEQPGQPVRDPHGAYTPVAFGPLGRGWAQRARYAGTYDERWLKDDFPFLPKDFDERYYQAAPADQQIPHPKAALEVVLEGVTPDGVRRFTLPYFEAPVHVFPKRGERENYTATLDTIVFEPDAERFTMTWRVARPLKKSLHEIAQVLVGRKGREWWQQREQVAFPIPVVMVPADAPAEAAAGAAPAAAQEPGR